MRRAVLPLLVSWAITMVLVAAASTPIVPPTPIPSTAVPATPPPTAAPTTPAPTTPVPAFPALNAFATSAGALSISEVMAYNSGSTVRDADGEPSPWIELHNGGAGAVSLAGWTLTTANAASPVTQNSWSVGALSIPAGAFATVLCNGKNRPWSSPPQANFTLFELKSGLLLSLRNPTGALQASLDYRNATMLADVSLGSTAAGLVRYFVRPTPGAANDESAASLRLGVSSPPVFDTTRAWVTFPLELTISSPDTTAVLTYTQDGTVPTTASPVVPTGAFNLTANVVLRVLACTPSYLCSPVQSSTYLDASLVAAQTTKTGFPSLSTSYPFGEAVGANTATCARDLHLTPQTPAITTALTTPLPVVSLAGPVTAFFGSAGVYDQPVGASAVPVSMEFFTSTDDANHLCTATALDAPTIKRSLALTCGPLTNSAGIVVDDWLDLNATIASAFTHAVTTSVTLRAGLPRSFAAAAPAAMGLDRVWQLAQLRAGGPGVRSASVHVFINAVYFGVYDLVDAVDAVFAGDVLSTAVTAATLNTSWAPSQWTVEANLLSSTPPPSVRFVLTANLSMSAPEFAANVANATSTVAFSALSVLVLQCFWSQSRACLSDAVAVGRQDGALPLTVVATGFASAFNGSFSPSGGNYVWGAWSAVAFDGLSATDQRALPWPQQLFRNLRTSPYFLLMFYDAVQRQCIDPSGGLTDATVLASLAYYSSQLSASVPCEAARWGDAAAACSVPPPVLAARTVAEWTAEIARVRTALVGNTARVLSALQAEGLYPPVLAPAVLPATGGTLPAWPAGVQMSTAPSSSSSSGVPPVFWFTLDGSDPLFASGNLTTTPSAFSYNRSLGLFLGPTDRAGAVLASQLVTARVLVGTQWSALRVVNLTVSAAAFPAGSSASVVAVDGDATQLWTYTAADASYAAQIEWVVSPVSTRTLNVPVVASRAVTVTVTPPAVVIWNPNAVSGTVFLPAGTTGVTLMVAAVVAVGTLPAATLVTMLPPVGGAGGAYQIDSRATTWLLPGYYADAAAPAAPTPVPFTLVPPPLPPTAGNPFGGTVAPTTAWIYVPPPAPSSATVATPTPTLAVAGNATNTGAPGPLPVTPTAAAPTAWAPVLNVSAWGVGGSAVQVVMTSPATRTTPSVVALHALLLVYVLTLVLRPVCRVLLRC